ncbi:hypothetical protein DIT68_13930 [Brumimicrobium oceani]|uniref:Uncharacterized protein n=1 Tax=Brumimicrobium oceani TaxID=2100725 RepID=A0A2U2X343_9FLAO|nr:hypothetical protein DIT68_13930 [Brumimicrobium oceani]
MKMIPLYIIHWPEKILYKIRLFSNAKVHYHLPANQQAKPLLISVLLLNCTFKTIDGLNKFFLKKV